MSLLVGTAQGLYSVSLGPGSATARLAGLQARLINHVAAAVGGGGGGACSAAAAVPRLQTGDGQLHRMLGAEQVGEDASGLHLLRSASESADAAWTCERVWSGDARSCGIWATGSGGSGLHLAVGTEPADVFCSHDRGSTWSAGTNSFAALDSRPQWTFPPPPHQPHVLSLERLASGQLVAGVEVGGVLVSTDAAGSCWEERSTGLYVDVHSCRVDPRDDSHWLAVTGRGLYATSDAGASWEHRCAETFRGKYTTGLAFNPQRQGEVLVTAGDRPPGVGVHVYHSTDAGSSWQEVTGVVFGGECAGAKGGRTPVPYFACGLALLGTATGHLLGAADGARRQWKVLCDVSAQVTCMAAPRQSPSSVMH